MSKYTISFVAILAAFFFAYSVMTDISASANKKNDQYSNYLTTATHDAAKQMKTSVEDGIAMPNQVDREAVRDTFFKSLAKDFGYTTEEDQEVLHIYVPALLMIDTNGYYVVYNQLESGEVKSVLTNLNTWTKSTEANGYKFDIQYFLGHRIKLSLGIDKDGDNWTYMSYDDDYYDVAEKVERDLTNAGKDSSQISKVMSTLEEYGIRKHVSEISTLGSEEAEDVTEAFVSADVTVANVNSARDKLFESFRNSFIIPELEEKVNYYINANNDAAAAYQDLSMNYVFTMPETTENDWTRLVKNPTVIGFLQGIRSSDGKEFLNIYALSSGEISKSNATTFTDESDTRTYYASGSTTNGSETGYVPGNGAAAGTGADVITQDRTEKNEQNADGTYVHYHWGDPILGTGCYSKAVNHVHTTNCYDIEIHHHVDKNGNTTATQSDDGTLLEATQVATALGSGGCYTTPFTHKHTDSCYSKVFHHHSGSPVTGGGCYTIPLYHQHTSSCYSEGKDITYQPTKDVYHEHKDPVYYYKKVGDTSGKEYTKSEVDADTSESTYYIVRIDASGDTCYTKITYARRKYTVTGTKTYTVNKTYDPTTNATLVRSDFSAPAVGKYKITVGDKDVEKTLEKGDKVSLEFGQAYTTVTVVTASSSSQVLRVEKKEKVNITLENGSEYTWSETKYDSSWSDGKHIHYTETIDADSYWTYDGTVKMSDEKDYATETSGDGKSLVSEGYTYLEMEKTCGKDTNTIEETIPYGDPITSHKKGELICGMTNKTIIGYTTGCGKIDVSDPDSQEMQDYRDGYLDADYILSRSLERVDIICGEDENTIEGYSLSCGKKEGQTIYTLKEGEAEKVNTVDHYELGCGIENGQTITKAQYEKEQREKAAAGY